MKLTWPMVALMVLLAGTLAGVGYIFAMRLNRGDSFPPYSSLRADPLGTRLLFEGLSEMPGLRVSRSYEPLERLTTEPNRTLFISGFASGKWGGVSAATFQALDRAVRGGGRVIIAMRAVNHHGTETSGLFPNPGSRPKKTDENPADDSKKKKAKKPKPEPTLSFAEKWDATVQTRWLMGDAKRTDAAPADFPGRLRTGSDIFFKLNDGSPWTVLYRRGTEPVVLERSLGRGSIVLLADAYWLSNEAMQRDRAPSLLAWLVGSSSVVEFNEGQLGLFEDRGIMALARSYGLTGAFVALAVAALLFIWNRMALFVPPPSEPAEVGLAYNQVAGLEALMRRTFSRDELAAACLKEWRTTARAVDLTRAEHAVGSVPVKSTPARIYNAVVRALRHRTKPVISS